MSIGSTPAADLVSQAPAGQSLRFFTPHEARTVEAVMGRIMPDDELGPGAVEAGTVSYADHTLAGVEQGNQTRYRAGVKLLDAACRARFGHAFADCGHVEQDAMVSDMAAGSVPPVTGAAEDLDWAVAFFELLREHTLEGMFSDPVHGGNRDLAGWKLLGYLGPQPGYSHEEQQLDAVVVRDRIFTAADYPLEQAGERP